MKAVVTSKGQVTIPLAIREKAHIVPGSKVDFQIEKDGSLRVCLLSQDVSQLKGMVKSKKRKPVSLKAMKNAIKSAAEEALK